MKRSKLRIMAVCVMMMMGLMLSSCGIADIVNHAVSEIVQEATGMVFDEMGGGETVTLAVGDVRNDWDLNVVLINNAVSIHTHADSMMRIEFSPPTTGEYVTPVVGNQDGSGPLEITDPPSNFTIDGNNRPGILRIFLPQNVVAFNNMDLRTTNGAARIMGNDGRMANNITITVSNGLVELRDFNAEDIAATSTNGTVSGSNLAAYGLALRTTNGIVTLRDSVVSGDLVARTTNGGVTLENVEADMDRADVNAVNGHVTIR